MAAENVHVRSMDVRRLFPYAAINSIGRSRDKAQMLVSPKRDMYPGSMRPAARKI